MKKIILYSDGTGNSSGSPHKTNVWRAYQALDKSENAEQVAYYDNGVGTSSFTPTAILGLAFGWGLAKNVKKIYQFVCRTYEEGNSEIYCFGFSRGAFTIRVVAALIASQGIIDRRKVESDLDLDLQIASAYRKYREQSFTPSLLSFFMAPVRNGAIKIWRDWFYPDTQYDPAKNIGFSNDQKSDGFIKFIGVWDTVDAYGGPIDELTRAWDKVVWPLSAKDRDLSPRVTRACHALALDEQRESFEPMLWNEEGAVNENRIKQVWFAGVHANVGGGYPDDGLAHVSLNWMLEESEKDNGLRYIDSVRKTFQDTADSVGAMYNNRAGLGNLYRYAPRNLKSLCKSEKPGLANWLKQIVSISDAVSNAVKISTPKIHVSVFDRIFRGGDSYAPINIPERYAITGTNSDRPEITALDLSLKDLPDRMQKQQQIWGLVWERKVLYILTLLVAFIFLVYPYLPSTNGSDTDNGIVNLLRSVLGTLGYYVSLIPGLVGKLPGFGFASAWAGEYEKYPFVFVIFLILIAVLMMLSAKLRAKINAGMRLIWNEALGIDNSTTSSVQGRRVRLHKLVSSIVDGQVYHEFVAKYVRVSFETFFILIFLLLLFCLTSRIIYTAVDGLGGVCNKESGTVSQLDKPFYFSANVSCFNTGLSVRKGERYTVEMLVDKDWKDKDIAADLNGLIDPPWHFSLLTLIKRHMSVDWFQPVFRVSNTLFDRHPVMRNAGINDEDRPVLYWKAEIKPIRSGKLFVYLNDAVLFVPDFYEGFYSNNQGTACMKVQKFVSDSEVNPGAEENLKRLCNKI